MTPKTLNEDQHIEEILQEANAYGLRYEVETYANKIRKSNPKISKIDSYILAYEEWIK